MFDLALTRTNSIRFFFSLFSISISFSLSLSIHNIHFSMNLLSEWLRGSQTLNRTLFQNLTETNSDSIKFRKSKFKKSRKNAMGSGKTQEFSSWNRCCANATIINGWSFFRNTWFVCLLNRFASFFATFIFFLLNSCNKIISQTKKHDRKEWMEIWKEKETKTREKRHSSDSLKIKSPSSFIVIYISIDPSTIRSHRQTSILELKLFFVYQCRQPAAGTES